MPINEFLYAPTLDIYDSDTLIGKVNGATGQSTRNYTWGDRRISVHFTRRSRTLSTLLGLFSCQS